MFSMVSFLMVPTPTFSGDFFHPKIQDGARKPEVVLFWHIKYHLRPRSHNLKLTVKNSSISQSDFITRMLFEDVY